MLRIVPWIEDIWISSFGTYQTNWRQERLGKVSGSSSYYLAWQKEAEWASRIAPVRDAYYTGLGTAVSDLTRSIFDAAQAYSDSLLDAEIGLASAQFGAERGKSESQFENMVTKERALLSASLSQAQSQALNELSEAMANARLESETKRERSDRVNDALFANQDALNGALNGNNPMENLPSNPDQAFSHEDVDTEGLADLLAQLNDDFNGEDDDSESDISTGESGNASDRAASDAQADTAYATAVANAQAAYTAAETAIESAYNTALESAQQTYANAQQQMQTAYETSVTPALTAFNTTYANLTCLYSEAVATIDNGNTIGNNYFETEDAEVCFVAGTPILMADGTSKPIDQIRPGDVVLSIDHNDPEHNTPKPAQVTRFFDNGQKSVVKLIFENSETKEQIEVTCTPSHRFYVLGKGWTTAESLQNGDQCTSANGTEITFLSREELQSLQHVYNFEVEEKHTYFVGHNNTFAILAHNECWLWEVGKGFGSGLWTGFKGVTNGLSSAVVSTVSLGFKDYSGPFELTETDIANGGLISQNISKISGELLIGAVTGGAGSLASKSTTLSLGVRRCLNVVNLFDSASNVSSVVRGSLNMYINDDININNTLQVIGGIGGLSGNLSHFAITIPKKVPPTGYTVVSRWGRPGLQDGDWIVVGDPNLLNYLRSFKWDFISSSNKISPFSSGESFVVPSGTIHWPSGGFTIDGAWKGIFGQRRYFE